MIEGSRKMEKGPHMPRAPAGRYPMDNVPMTMAAWEKEKRDGGHVGHDVPPSRGHLQHGRDHPKWIPAMMR